MRKLWREWSTQADQNPALQAWTCCVGPRFLEAGKYSPMGSGSSLWLEAGRIWIRRFFKPERNSSDRGRLQIIANVA
ncbi:MAG: hypothetical protein R3B47_11885 [Bacteroidia bacterium]